VRLRAGLLIVALVAVVAGRPAPVEAHHSVANFWEQGKIIAVTGVVTKVMLVNPHPSLFMDVMEDGKKVQYVAILGQGVASLAKFGLTKDSLPAGTKLTVDGHPPKASGSGGAKGILVFAFTFEDGKKVVLGDEAAAFGVPRNN
jgi:Family of unknown function (DUF6152)